MSQADIQRFVSDLKENQALLDEVKSGAIGLEAVVELAQARGYDITVDEAKAYIRDQANQELSDEQLDMVAGGKGHHHHHSVKVKVEVVVVAVEAAAAVTTVAEAAEVASTAVEAAEVATTVGAAAEVVVVAT